MAQPGPRGQAGDGPIFSKNKVNFNPTSPITQVGASNGKIVIAVLNKVITRIDLRDADHPIHIDLREHNVDAKLSNMFLDSSGDHLILTFSPKDSVNPAEVMYLGPKMDRPKEVPALKGHVITAVGWNPELEGCTPQGTKPFLMGTSKGCLFEAEIVGGEVRNVRQVYDIAQGNPAVVSGLEYFVVPKTNKIVVLVATAKRLYQFCGSIQGKEDKPSFHGLFMSYINQSKEEYFKEFGPPSPTGVKVFSDHAVSRLGIEYLSEGTPMTIVYLTDAGAMMYHSTMNTPPGIDEDDYLAKLVLTSYPKVDSGRDHSGGQPDLPKSVVATQYHTLFLYKNYVRAVCVLNEDVIFEDEYSEVVGRPANLARDRFKGTIWCFTDKLIFKYKVNQEERNVWKIFLDKGDFHKASEFAKHDADKMEIIRMKQAEDFFNKKDYELSAMYFSMTSASFEEVALKFVQADDTHALKMFLMKKLGSLQSTDIAKTTALTLWVIELFLHELGTLRDFGKQDTAEYRNLDQEFTTFMAQPLVKDCVSKNKKAVYDLMSSHGDRENLLHFTITMKDYDEVIENNINSGQYQAALSTLLKQKDASLYAKFIPVLLDKDPKSTIDMLITTGRMLSPLKLLPKFSSKLAPDTAIQVTRYLEHCVNNLKNQDESVHDYLVSLYVYYHSPETLMEYFENQGNNIHTVRYDAKHALMMCLEKDLRLPSIHLYTLMGLYEEAVTLAIKTDLELAKTVADAPEDDIEMKRRLWLKIAKHVVQEKNDIQQAMDFLHQCELLKIEDVLPFFPEFVTIDHFKDAICSSLQEYNQHIQQLKFEMDEATKSAEMITEEIHAVRNRCSVIRATDQCTVCDNVLLIRSFYAFPCGHKFHSDCLLTEILPMMTEPRRKLLDELQKKLRDASKNHDVMSTGSSAISVRDQLKSDVDEIIASECIYCGDTMIKLVDVPFIPEEEYYRVQREWE